MNLRDRFIPKVFLNFEKNFKCPECGDLFTFRCLASLGVVWKEYDWWCLRYRTHVMDCTNQRVEAILEKKA